MKLSELIKAWDVLHQKDTGEIGFCDLDNALRSVGVIIRNDIDSSQSNTGNDREVLCPTF